MHNIPISNPLASALRHREMLESIMSKVLQSGWYILGNEVSNFEKIFAHYNQTKYAVGVASGTDALFLSLKALNIGQGDGVITVSHTAVATVAAIRMTGATPILLDVDSTYNLDVSILDRFLRENGLRGRDGLNIKAVIPVHLYGNPCGIGEILELSREFDIKVIEDCAQAHGAEIDDLRVGQFGDVGCFSFYPTKNLGALGDGGAIITGDLALREKLVQLRQYGWSSRYISSVEGYNSRLDELQAAILNAKIQFLDADNESRGRIGRAYLEGLHNSAIELPVIASSRKHVFHLFVVRSRCREKLVNYLSRVGISTAVHYPVPIHQQPAYRNICVVPYNLALTEELSGQVLSLPMYPEMKEHDVNYVIEHINNFSS